MIWDGSNRNDQFRHRPVIGSLSSRTNFCTVLRRTAPGMPCRSQGRTPNRAIARARMTHTDSVDSACAAVDLGHALSIASTRECVQSYLLVSTKHGLNQAISREGHGVATKAIVDAVNNPVKTVAGMGGATKYVGKDATVVLNEAGQVITTYGKPRY